MVLKIINATEARVGTNILIDGRAFTIKKIDISKTGKHGHAKCRIESDSIIGTQRKVFVVPGHDRLEVPLVDKKKAQVLSIAGNTVSVMDLETFESLDIECEDEELKGKLKENSNVEYWDVEGDKILRRAL
ncbi:translation initiation factor IF-5A [archaeon]|jgi:translation initiation factor 5A|nr:translation initiation factor IF-5A [archaeon]